MSEEQLKEIAILGDRIREMKTAGAAKEEFMPLVEQLKALKTTAAAADGASSKQEASKAKVTPWEVTGEVDYEKLLRDFGTQPLTPELIGRMEKLTSTPAHRFLKRGLFFSHRDLEEILKHHEAKKPFYLYTGRGPSSDSLHLGHMIPFLMTKYLQEAFDVPVFIQMTDDEKFLWKDVTIDQVNKYCRENVKDIIACGFDLKKTFIFSDFSYVGQMYQNITKIRKCITLSTVRAVFGLQDSDNIGKVGFAAVQAAPSFASSFPDTYKGAKNVRCLIPCAIDQDPYFRVTRDVAARLKEFKPALIHSKFFPALQGFDTKMSASAEHTAIYLTDTAKQIKKKINKYAFSGGKTTAEEQREFGANLDIDVSYHYLTFFLDNDEELARIGEEYKTGKLLTGEVKAILIKVLSDFVQKHQEARAKVTEEMVDEFMRARPLSV